MNKKNILLITNFFLLKTIHLSAYEQRVSEKMLLWFPEKPEYKITEAEKAFPQKERYSYSKNGVTLSVDVFTVKGKMKNSIFESMHNVRKFSIMRAYGCDAPTEREIKYSGKKGIYSVFENCKGTESKEWVSFFDGKVVYFLEISLNKESKYAIDDVRNKFFSGIEK